MTRMTTESRMDQNCIQCINNRLSIWLGHIWPNIQVLRIFYLLNKKRETFFWNILEEAAIHLTHQWKAKNEPHGCDKGVLYKLISNLCWIREWLFQKLNIKLPGSSTLNIKLPSLAFKAGEQKETNVSALKVSNFLPKGKVVRWHSDNCLKSHCAALRDGHEVLRRAFSQFICTGPPVLSITSPDPSGWIGSLTVLRVLTLFSFCRGVPV